MNDRTILIVENEAIVATDLAGKLRALGYEVAGIAAGGEEAVTLACRLRPHLVLMDIQLDGSMDGIEAAEAIRSRQDVPVIYLTAHSDAATLARAKLTGPFGYILKPFEERELATQIELALYKHQADRQVREQRERLRESNDRYELVLAGAEAGIWDWDVPYHKVVFSPQWKAMRGFAEHEVSDAEEEWSRAMHPEDAPRVMAAVQAHFEGKTPIFAEEYRVRRKDGSWMWVADRGLARHDANGRVVRMAGSETDITERKAAEEALRKSRDELEHRVQERTAELRTSMRKLQESNQALQDFADCRGAVHVTRQRDHRNHCGG